MSETGHKDLTDDERRRLVIMFREFTRCNQQDSEDIMRWSRWDLEHAVDKWYERMYNEISDSSESSSESEVHVPNMAERAAPTDAGQTDRNERSCTVQADSPTASTSPRHQERSRKRDHEPGSERISKALKPSHETSM